MRNTSVTLYASVPPPQPLGTAHGMTVTDPDVPDPLNDPRTLQADPGAYGEGADLASAEDDAPDDLTGDYVTGGFAGT